MEGCCWAALMVWEEPLAHWKVRGAVNETPSTTTARPGGLVVTVIACEALVKLAVTLLGALIVTDTGLADPAVSPDQVENCCPDDGVAVS
jgi:hypothetical protein